ncbi:MAG TPA: TetR/AcrR family transcriptional regulator [Candidatus Eremiobacteraceae bacterium]
MANRRQHIIESAADIVYRKGFAGTTVDDMLRAAGVGKGNFYHYFRSKDDLGLAIVDELGKALNGPTLDEVFSHSKSPLQRLTDYIALVRERRHADNCGDALANLAAELGHVERFGERIRRAYAALIDRFEALVTEIAIETGSTADARVLARALVVQIDGACLLFKVDGDVAAFDASLATIAPALMAFVRVSAPSPENVRPNPIRRT